jgi:hypothetical protein
MARCRPFGDLAWVRETAKRWDWSPAFVRRDRRGRSNKSRGVPFCRLGEKEVVKRKIGKSGNRDYADHLPLYRLGGIFKRFGVELSRSTMCDCMAVSADLLAPIVKLMLRKILTSKVTQNDDTPLLMAQAQRVAGVLVSRSESR